MLDYPFVSIIIPAFNAEALLPMCLNSIMNLNYPKNKFEILVINNNSTDSTEAIAKKYPVRLLNESSVQSAYAARNKGITFAKGETFAFTDTDCVVSPEWLQHLLLKHNDLGIGCFAGNILSYQTKTLSEKFADLDEECHNQYHELTTGYLPSANTANVAYRREIFEKIGLFNPHLRWSGDAEFTWRFCTLTNYEIHYAPEAIVYHKHRSSLKGLFRQHMEYGEGIADLLKLYPDSCADTLCFIEDIFRFGFRGVMHLPKNLYLHSRGKISLVESCFDLLKAFCRLGLVSGRIKAQGRNADGRVSASLLMRYILSKFLLRLRAVI